MCAFLLYYRYNFNLFLEPYEEYGVTWIFKCRTTPKAAEVKAQNKRLNYPFVLRRVFATQVANYGCCIGVP